MKKSRGCGWERRTLWRFQAPRNLGWTTEFQSESVASSKRTSCSGVNEFLDNSLCSISGVRVLTDLVHVCAVNDTSDWWHTLLAVTDQYAYLSLVSYIALANFNPHAIKRQSLHEFHGVILSFPTS